MKQINFFLSFILFGLISEAQITLNYGDLVSAGDTVINFTVDDLSAISPGGTGEQTWNFAGLTPGGTDTLCFVAPDETLAYDVFPDTDLGLKILTTDDDGNPDTIWIYLDQSTDFLHIIGISASLFGNAKPVPYQNLMPYPVTYGDVFYSDYTSVVKTYIDSDSIMFKSDVHDTVYVNAFGELTTPAGTFNTLRFFHDKYEIDSTFVKIGDTWIFADRNINDDNYYEWWTNDPEAKMKILEITVSQSGEVTDGNYTGEAKIHSSEIPALTNKTNIIFENTGDFLIIKNIPEGFKNIIVYDISGKEILSAPVNRAEERIFTGGQSAGLYLVSLVSPYMSISKKIIMAGH
ncbi:MAG: T9SS type A sorting domain-containing protein [Chlorobi bacterium]|nr:T9SS type A sorting domain-containing protein [Chlorobiota bacterium]